MRSHAILRTNVGLTTNAKIMVTSLYSLYIDAIISNPELSSTKYKRKEFNKSNYLDELIPFFFKGTPVDIAFSIKDDIDNKNMSKDFSNQYDDIYQYGARNIIENKDYTEEFEYFAPLHVSKTGLPTKFIIFRLDGPGLANSTKETFKSDVLDKLKCVKIFDLTRSTPLGEWLEFNIIKNKNFPQTGLYVDFRNLEFSSWIGIDYEDGGYSEKSFMLDSNFRKEKTYQDFEKLIIDGYKNTKVVYPHILNMSFLFDDTPATPTSLKKWSLNRYMGYYLDSLELVKYVSPYLLPQVKKDVVIDENNLLYSLSEQNPLEQTFRRIENLYIEVDGQFYKIESYLEQQPSVLARVQVSRNTYEERPNRTFITKYKIISDISLEGRQSEINKNTISIESLNGLNKITGLDGDLFEIDGFDEADVWLIEIDEVYHNLIKRIDGNIYINTDYAFQQSLEKFEYYINDPDSNYRKIVSLIVDSNNSPKKFGIYKCKFTDIKDFDSDIVDTEYSKHEYIYRDKLTDSDETKMYAVNQNSTSFPKDIDDFRINGVVVNIPASSEYTANTEIFRIVDNDLNNLWKKNAKRVKWGFQNSISSNDYPYLLNNSVSSEDFNRTTGPLSPLPNRQERNLDYFLTINPDTNQYSHHSLHVVDEPEITFNTISRTSTFTVLTGISDVGYFNTYDLVQIESENGYYATTSRIRDIILLTTGWSLTLDLVHIPTSGTVSGTVVNLTRTSFNVEKYLNIDYDLDYFNYFFSKKTLFDNDNIVKNTHKSSHFNSGDNSTPNITLFRGLKYKIWDVTNVKTKDEIIEAINIKSSNNYEDYKFAVLLSKNNYSILSNSNAPGQSPIEFRPNLMKWQVIDEWKHDKIYQSGNLVKYNESIYISVTQSQILDPNVFPHNSDQWNVYGLKNIFWNSIVDGSGVTASNNMFELGTKIFSLTTFLPPLVFNHQEYYYSNGTNGNNFWSPGFTYSLDQVVIHRDKIWKSTADNNKSIPNNKSNYLSNGNYRQWWIETPNESTIWVSVELWRFDQEYSVSNSLWSSLFTPGHYVIYEDVVYVTTTNTMIGVIPTLDLNWKRVYSLLQDTNFQYSVDFNNNYNPIIQMNNRLYLCRENGILVPPRPRRGGQPTEAPTLNSLSTLENGITIFVNKKWRNVLINIYVNDNTYTTIEDFTLGSFVFKKDNLSKSRRDNLYTDIYSKLTANNFMNAINDLSNFFSFSDKVRYVVINEDLTTQVYDFNNLNTVENLPVLITCEGPDEFLMQTNSLRIRPTTLSISEIKPKRQLDGGEIASMEEINYYTENSLGTIIEENKEDPFKVANYSGLKNNLYNNLFRHSGYYSPIYHDIELFKAASLTQSNGNYKFDTELTYFGKIKERIVSKINKDKNILKLKNSPDLNSIYPMIDEFGYHTISFYIFKSTWDFEYHIECREIPQIRLIKGNQSFQLTTPSNQTNNNNLELL